MAKELRMNQAQMNQFEREFLDKKLLHGDAKGVISYLNQFIIEVEQPKSDKKDEKKS